MPVILALVGIITAAYFLIMRARNAADMTRELVDVANDVRLAARRFGFRRQKNLHPAESIEDPNIAIAAISTAFLALDDLPTRDQRTALTAQLQQHLSVSPQDAVELSVLGQWLVTECGTADSAISRISRKLFRLSGGAGLAPLLAVVQGTLTAGASSLNVRQKDALEDVSRAFRIR